MILPPSSYDLILTIKTRTYDSEDFKDIFDGYDTFHFEKQPIRSIRDDYDQPDAVSIYEN